MRYFAIIFMMFGMIALFFGVRSAAEGLAARNWPTAQGRMLQARVTEFRTAKNIRIARLCLDLDYLYMVGDKIYEGHRLNSGWRCFGSQEHVREILARYPSGKELKVYYNPDNPALSMLEPGLDWTVFFLLGVGVINCSVAWPLMKRSMRR